MPALRASLGYVGSVTFGDTLFGDVTVRATSCDVRASQEITYPDVVDGRIDRTVYQLGPRLVGGTVAFPLLHEGVVASSLLPCGQTTPLGELFWKMSSQRDQFGRLQNDRMTLRVRYTDDTAFQYPACLVNSLTISVTQGDVVTLNVDIMGGANSSDNVRISDPFSPNLNFASPIRSVTWNDFVIALYGDSFIDSLGNSESQFTVVGDQIRSFEVTINNNAERFFSLNNRLAPQDITAKKREISGRIVLMGRNSQISELAYTNQSRFTTTAGIGFGYTLGSNSTPYWVTGLHGVVFQIEEIAITNQLVETTVPFTALADCQANYEATQIGRKGALVKPSGSNYGGPTAPGFPNFGF